MEYTHINYQEEDYSSIDEEDYYSGDDEKEYIIPNRPHKKIRKKIHLKYWIGPACLLFLLGVVGVYASISIRMGKPTDQFQCYGCRDVVITRHVANYQGVAHCSTSNGTPNSTSNSTVILYYPYTMHPEWIPTTWDRVEEWRKSLVGNVVCHVARESHVGFTELGYGSWVPTLIFMLSVWVCVVAISLYLCS